MTCHPVEHADHKEFNEELDSLYTNIPQNAELFPRQDITLNVGNQSEMFTDVVGTNGIDNRNAKGKYFLFLLGANNFRLLLSYFKHNNYVTWRSFNTKKLLKC